MFISRHGEDGNTYHHFNKFFLINADAEFSQLLRLRLRSAYSAEHVNLQGVGNSESHKVIEPLVEIYFIDFHKYLL
jgi:hypothetical protein